MTLQEMERLMTKIAVMHYIEGIAQQDIAARLKISGSKVSRMLARAREEGIVRTYIHSPVATICELEAEIEREFGVKEAVIVPDADGEDTSGRLAIAGANTLHRMLERKCVLGVSFSHPLASVVHQLHGNDMEGVRVVQMMGVQSNTGEDMQALEIVQKLGRIFGTHPQILFAPGAVSSREVHDSLMKEPGVRNVLELAASADVAVLGLGDMTQESQVFRDNYLDERWRQDLLQSGAVGYVCMRFFDRDGNICHPEFDERVIGLELEKIRKIPTVIAMASGRRKVAPIRGALRGGLVDILVTDEATARAVLQDEMMDLRTQEVAL